MTNALSTLTQGRGVTPVSRPLADLTSRLHNKLEPIPGEWRRCALSAADAPSEAQRTALVERRDHLDEALAPCEPARVLRAVGMLRSVMAVPSVDDATRQLQRQAFVATLTRYPGWAVEAACERLLGADVGEGVHAPKPGEIAVLCRQMIAEAQFERARLGAILEAKVYTPPTDAERAEVSRRFADVVAELTAASAENRTAEAGAAHAERQAARADLAAREAAVRESAATTQPTPHPKTREDAA